MQAKQRNGHKLGGNEVPKKSFDYIDDIRDHVVARKFLAKDFTGTRDALFSECTSGRGVTFRDRSTGETLLHVFCEEPHFYSDDLSLCYLLCSKIDLDCQDTNGDSVLHKVCRCIGAWEIIIALVRFGASMRLRNKCDRTAREEILLHRKPGWQENLHWHDKFYPGLWGAVLCDQPELALVERLLGYWCRTSKNCGKNMINLKCIMSRKGGIHFDLIRVLEKYENTTEMALAMIAGTSKCDYDWNKPEVRKTLNVNTKDLSYQYNWRDFPTAPRPLLAMLWQLGDVDNVKKFLKLGPDTSIKYTFELESTSPPKPLFFQIVNPKCRPAIANVKIVSAVLKASDLNIRNTAGQTILVEAMYAGETKDVIMAILDAGVDVAARDGLGMTARDHADFLDNTLYRQLIDDHVKRLVTFCDYGRIQNMILQMYEDEYQDFTKSHLIMKKCLLFKHASKMRSVLSCWKDDQMTLRTLFDLAKDGEASKLTALTGPKHSAARDKAGRSLLHVVIQHNYKMAPSCNACIDNDRFTCGDVDHNTMPIEPEIVTDATNKLRKALKSVSLRRNIIPITDIAIEKNTEGYHGSPYPMLVSYKSTDVMQRASCEENTTTEYLCSTMCELGGFLRKNTQARQNSPLCSADERTSPGHLEIVKFLLSTFPSMVHSTNNLGQTPLHYAYIFATSRDVLDLLRNAGASLNTKDVFDLVPEDYSLELHGHQTFQMRRQSTVELDLKIFLHESRLEENFNAAIRNADEDKVKELALQLVEHGGESMFESCLFDCLDLGLFDLTLWLVQAGFSTDISRQYETCDPDNPMCAMMECTHHVTTLRQRAVEVGATQLVSLIDETALAAIVDRRDSACSVLSQRRPSDYSDHSAGTSSQDTQDSGLSECSETSHESPQGSRTPDDEHS